MLMPRAGAFAGSDKEEYLRTLQLLGVVPLNQWSIRALGPRELDRFGVADSTSLAKARPGDWCTAPCGGPGIGFARAGLLPLEASTWFNSSQPFGINDGAAWRGRGLTAAVTGGLHARLGPLSAVLAPVATWAQNQEFPLEPNGRTGELQYADQFFPGNIDHPQRFGDAAYSRMDFGESTLRLDLAGVAVGISTASQWWGPMSAYPYLMSNNAGGFPHVFAGTSRPANIGIGRLHARVIYGELAQSDYSPMPDSAGRRFASGVVAVFQPRGLEALEVGGGRFFASVWPKGGIDGADLRKPFEGILKASRGRSADGGLVEDVHNQLASVFARLTLPASGVEVYGEFGREDHNADMRDFWMEPDHDATFGIGLRRAWRSSVSVASVFTAEFMNSRVTHLTRVRGQVPPYTHGEVRQGHTHRGQPLGTGIGARSGEALLLSLRRYAPGATSALSLARHGEAPNGEGAERLVRFMGSAERSLFRGPFEIRSGIVIVHRVGREEARSATNLGLSLQSRWTPGPGGW